MVIAWCFFNFIYMNFLKMIDVERSNICFIYGSKLCLYIML